MPTLYYKDAQKMAQKELRICISHGKYPYLPVLSDFIDKDLLNYGNTIGIIQIPLEFIVGTYSHGRSQVFARNFMPLMEEDTEFSTKWKALCQSHLEEGIRDPIKVYEYMNRYFVQEGNKRVSVLKYFGADSIDAQVIRILPPKNTTLEVQLYYEFLDFYQCSKVNFIEFSKLGSYTQLQQYLGKSSDEIWSEDDRKNFSSAYYLFRQVYEEHGGKKLASTVGDALLVYLRVFGYHSLNDKVEIKKKISQLWEEIVLQQDQFPIDVKLFSQSKKPGILTKLLSVGEKKVMKVAFIHDKDPSTSSWTKGHEQGREYVQKVFGNRIETVAYFNAMDSDPQAIIKKAIAQKNNIIFTTSPRLLPAALKSAVEHPEVTILNCSLNQSHRYICTYYARMYEAKFVIGAIAGAMAGNEDVGYLCDYPIYGQIAGVNAFALGVQMVNPRAKVYLEWTAVESAVKAIEKFRKRGIRLISSQDLTKQGEERRSSFGLSLITDFGQVNLAVPLWQWGVYYESMIRNIQNKSFKTEYVESHKALNYYWGMSNGVIELSYTKMVPASIQKLANLLQDSIRADLCYPFKGEIYTQEGKEIVGNLTPEQIINMDWLVENVEGSIPVYDELTEMGKSTVDMVGVDSVIKDRKE